eukprot:PhF_6_TR7992/c0_g1_i1/m.12268
MTQVPYVSFLIFTLFVFVCTGSYVRRDKKAYHGFHELGNLNGFYPSVHEEDTCHPKGHHYIKDFKHRNARDQKVILKYNVSFKKDYDFVTVRGDVSHIVCGFDNTVVFLLFRLQEDARLFHQELMIADVVTSFPPYQCGNGKTIHLYLFEHALLPDNVTVYMSGRPLGVLEVFEHAHIHFETDLLKARHNPDHNYTAEYKGERTDASNTTAHENVEKRYDLRRTLLAEPLSGLALFKADPFTFAYQAMTAANNEKSASLKKEFDESVRKDPGTIVRPIPVKPKSNHHAVSQGHKRQMKADSFFGTIFAPYEIKVDFNYKPKSPKETQKILEMARTNSLKPDAAKGDTYGVDRDALDKWSDASDTFEWKFTTISNKEISKEKLTNTQQDLRPVAGEAPIGNTLPGIDSWIKQLMSVFGETGLFDSTISTKILPLFLFRINFNSQYHSDLNKQLRLFELSWSFYYSYRFETQVGILDRKRLSDTEKDPTRPKKCPIFAGEVCLPIPLSVVSIMLCLNAEMNYLVKLQNEADLTLKFTRGATGWRKIGIVVGTDKPEANYNSPPKDASELDFGSLEDSFRYTTPPGYEPWLGFRCQYVERNKKLEPINKPLENKYLSITDCGDLCGKDTTCKSFVYEPKVMNENMKAKAGNCYLLTAGPEKCKGMAGSIFSLSSQSVSGSSTEFNVVAGCGDNAFRVMTGKYNVPESGASLSLSNIVRKGEDFGGNTKNPQLPSGQVKGVTFNAEPDPSKTYWFATGGDDSTVMIWSQVKSTTDTTFLMKTGWPATETKHEGVTSVILNKAILIVGYSDKYIRYYDLSKGASDAVKKEIYPSKSLQLECKITSMALFPDGKRIVASTDCHQFVTIIDISTAELKVLFKTEGTALGPTWWKRHSSPIKCVAVSGNGKYVASGSEDKDIIIWEIKDDNDFEIELKLEGHSGVVNSVSFYPQLSTDTEIPKYIVSGSSDRSVRIWDLVARKQYMVRYKHTGSVLSTIFVPQPSPSKPFVISGSEDTTIQVWDFDPPTISFTTATQTQAVFVALPTEAQPYRFATYDKDTIILYNAFGGTKQTVDAKFKTVIPSPISNPSPRIHFITAQAQTLGSAKIIHIVVASMKTNDMHYYKISDATGFAGVTPRVILTSTSDPPPPSTATTPGRGLASVILQSNEFAFLVYFSAPGFCGFFVAFEDATKPRVQLTLPQACTITAAAISARDTSYFVVIAYKGGSIKMYEPQDKTFVEKKVWEHKSDVNTVAIAPDNSFIISGGVDKFAIKVWSLVTLTRSDSIQEILGHTALVRQVAIAPDSNWFYSESADQTVRIWDFRTGTSRIVNTGLDAKSETRSLAVSPDGQALLCGHNAGVTVIKVSANDEYQTNAAPIESVLTLGANDEGVPNPTVMFVKTGFVYPEDFSYWPPMKVSVKATLFFALELELRLVLGVGDPTGFLLRFSLGGPYIKLAFEITFETKVELTLATAAMTAAAAAAASIATAGVVMVGNTAADILDTSITKNLNELLVDNRILLDLTAGLRISVSAGLALDIKISIGPLSKTIYQKNFEVKNLWSYGGKDKPLLKMQAIVNPISTFVCPINMLYRANLELKPELFVRNEDPTSPFNWERKDWPKNCPKQWKLPTPSKRRDFQLLANTLNQTLSIFPQSSDVFHGVCDAEVFSYTTKLTFVDTVQVKVEITIDEGVNVGGAEWINSACSVKGLYRVHGFWSDGAVDLIHIPNELYDVAKCWMQPIPNSFRAFLTQAGSKPGVWIYHPSTYCSDQHLRYASSEAILEEGEVLSTEMTMESMPPYAQLILHKDGNLALYAYESDVQVWESGTSVSGNRPVYSELSLKDGVVALTQTVDGVVTKKILNPNGLAGGRFLVVYECDLHLYPDSRLDPSTSLWNLTNKACPDVPESHKGPKYITGGNYLYRGESLMNNVGLWNENGMFEHERGRLHFTRTSDLSELWSLTSEAIRPFRTVAFTLQWDGNLVLVDYEGIVRWESGTAGSGATVLRVEKCGIALYKKYPNIDRVWSFGLDRDCPVVPDGSPLPYPPSYYAYPTKLNYLEPGTNLLPGSSVLSEFGQLFHQPDGNVVILSRANNTIPQPLWATNTAGQCTTSLMFQYDGALTLFGCNGKPLWTSGTAAQRAKVFEFRNDCTLYAYTSPFHSYVVTKLSVVKSWTTGVCSMNVPVNQVDPYYVQHYHSYWMESGFPIIRGESIGRPRTGLTLQPDGDLVFYGRDPMVVLWRSNTNGRCISTCEITKGNVILRDCDGSPTWSLFNTSQVPGEDGTFLTILGYNLVIETMYGDILWNSKDSQLKQISDDLTPPSSGGNDSGSMDNTQVIIIVITTFLATCVVCCILLLVIVLRMRSHKKEQRGPLLSLSDMKSPTGKKQNPTDHSTTITNSNNAYQFTTAGDVPPNGSIQQNPLNDAVPSTSFSKPQEAHYF